MRTIGLTFTPQNEPEAVETETSTTDYTDMKKSELIALCDDLGIELTASDKRSKAALIQALETNKEG